MASDNGMYKNDNGDVCSGVEERKVYLPGQPMEEDEKLVHDPSAYIMLHNANTVAPCLSFDILHDDLGGIRETFPLTMYLVSGTQTEKANKNRVILMKLSNLNKTQEENEEESDDDSEDSEDEEEIKKKPNMDFIQLKHHGCVNRIRSTVLNNSVLAAVWSEIGKVTILDLKPHLQTLDSAAASAYKNVETKREEVKPLFVFAGHQTEGYAVDWSPCSSGVLATGDCHRNIHLWKPTNDSWIVDQRPLVGHQKSVEDLQWSPNEVNVLASCSVDKSIRIWDVRESPANACKLTVENAHQSDVNVISWSRNEPFIVSGGDDGFLYVWDLRVFQTGKSVARLKHHGAPVSTVEWHPSDASVFASGGEDDQIAIWDLEAERDDSSSMEEDVKDLPPQLLFIHQGQKEIKELHWHSQIPGVIISTAVSGLNVFRTISI
ncbi:WD repeat-containing protein 1 l(2)09851 [Lycorma delicatula]|uniref:WD repeat-containing protein 1 l(2)09851 n=1 Tax=Lycorma delicatula TaxID=130591 RepID=UPI003F51029A